MMEATKQAVGRVLVRYYLSLRISAAVAMPEFAVADVRDPAPIVRQLPGQLRGIWDEREIIRDGEQTWIITRDGPADLQSTINWN